MIRVSSGDPMKGCVKGGYHAADRAPSVVKRWE